jgi:hypothetical protein
MLRGPQSTLLMLYGKKKICRYAAPEAPFRQENLDKMLPAAALYLGSEGISAKKKWTNFLTKLQSCQIFKSDICRPLR